MLTSPQFYAIAIIGLMMTGFVWGRYRYDIVAVVALLAALACGIVPLSQAFSGFSDDIVIIVGSALVVSAGVSRSGVMEWVLSKFAPNVTHVRTQMTILLVVVALLSAIIKNIGALAIMIPIAFQFARRSGVSPSVFLMPMAFASLLGGLMTLIGTSPNVVVSRVRQELTGQPFGMFDYTPVGFLLAGTGVMFLVLFYWILPVRFRTESTVQDAIAIQNYSVEAKVLETSAICGKTVSELLQIADGEAVVMSLLRDGGLSVKPFPDATFQQNDVILIEGGHEAIDRLVAQAGLSLTDNRTLAADREPVTAVEAVIGENSSLIGTTAEVLKLYERFNVNLLAVSRKNQRINEKLGSVEFQLGDVLVLQGVQSKLPEFLRDTGLLPLAERPLLLGSKRGRGIPIAILLAAMGATALGVVPVAVGFFTAAVLMVLSNVIPLREVYNSIEAPILIMLAALIPVSDALRTTGTTDLLAQWLATIGETLPAYGALALIMVAAMGVTPFLNNAATVLVMAPIAATFADSLGYKPEAFLMAVAIGAGSDFLTPIGHQCNTLVMGPGGYRFSDYPRLGLPLSVLVILISVPALIFFWPM